MADKIEQSDINLDNLYQAKSHNNNLIESKQRKAGVLDFRLIRYTEQIRKLRMHSLMRRNGSINQSEVMGLCRRAINMIEQNGELRKYFV